MRLFLFIICLSLSANWASAEQNSAMSFWIKDNTVKGKVIDFGYLIQPYDIGNNNLSKSFIYCVDVKNKMMVSAEPHAFVKKDSLKNEKQADIQIIFDEKYIPAGETRTVCLKLKSPKEGLNDGVYNAVGAILLNKTKAVGINIHYEVISATQDDTNNKEKLENEKTISLVASIILDDKKPLAGLVIDINELANKSYTFNANFLDIFGLDKRTTCKLEKKVKAVSCPPSLNTATSDCAENYYEISKESNKKQCYLFFNKKKTGKSKLTIYDTLITPTPNSVAKYPVEIKLFAR